MNAYNTPSLVDVFTADAGGYACYRVPSLVASDGILHMFVEARRTSCSDQAPKDILVARSYDSGVTWPSRQAVVGYSSGNQTYRNPYATVLQNGSLLLQFVNSTVQPWSSYQSRSDDKGITWTSPVAQAMHGIPHWLDGILAGPGTGIVLGRASSGAAPHPGRLVSCGTTGYQAGRNMTAAVWYSDDSGASWHVGKPVFPGMAECQVAELPEGEVLINFRGDHEDICDCRAQSRSSDGGSTWSKIEWVPQLIEPVCSAGLATDVSAGCQQDRIPAASEQVSQTAPLLVFSNPASKTKRLNMTVRASADGGATWPWEQLLWDGPSAYSCLTAMDAPWAIGASTPRSSSIAL